MGTKDDGRETKGKSQTLGERVQPNEQRGRGSLGFRMLRTTHRASASHLAIGLAPGQHSPHKATRCLCFLQATSYVALMCHPRLTSWDRAVDRVRDRVWCSV